MRFGILGAITVWTDGGDVVPVPGTKVRAVLADLLLHAGRPVSADRLIDDVWGDDPPGNAAGTLSAKVSQLRRALDGAEPGAKALVVSPPPGYSLRVADGALDADRFADLTARSRATTDPAQKSRLLTEALDLWRGEALTEFADEEFARATVVKLTEQRVAAQENLAFARLELHEHAALVAELGDLVVKHPLRERLRNAHMRALYGAGRQHEALVSYEEIRVLLSEELGLDPGAELVELQRAILAGDPGLDVPMIHVKRPTTNLPADLTGLIGRDDEITALVTALPSERLVTLTGPGGVGKTRLAIAAARTFGDAWLVELAGATRDAEVAGVVAAALGVRDDGDPLAAACAAVGERRLLLVVDNCEHVIEGAADVVAAMLRSAPSLTVLATSLERLGVPGEVVWPVDTLDDDAAVALFAARAGAAERTFRVDDDNRAAVGQLCRRLDGIPLAIELAASRVRSLDIHDLLDRLDDRFRLLATGYRGRPPRHQTLRAMIDWSWDLLSDAERVVLRRLAVHADGCTLAAADAVSGDSSEYLPRLVDRSLVQLTRNRAGVRYRLLESVAAYCDQRLAEAGEGDEIAARHLAFHLAASEGAELRGPGQLGALADLDAESANLHAALATAVRVSDAESALRLVDSLGWYWFLRGRFDEARRALDAALAVPGGTADGRARALAWRAGFGSGELDARTLTDITDPRARAFAEWFLAFTADVAPQLDSALAGFESTNDRWGVAAVELVEAMAAHIRGDAAELERCAVRSAKLFAAVGDRWGELQANEWLGALAQLRGELGEAERLHRAGLRIAEELELWPDVAGHLSWLGWIAMESNDLRTAIEHCEQALQLAAGQGSPAGRIFASMGLGFARRRAGDLGGAETVLQWVAEQAADAEPPPPYLPTVLCELGFIAELGGKPAAALGLHVRAYDVALAMEATRDAAYSLEGMAGALAAAGHFTDAAALLGTAAAVHEESGLPPSLTEIIDVERITAAVETALGSERFVAARSARIGPEEIHRLGRLL